MNCAFIFSDYFKQAVISSEFLSNLTILLYDKVSRGNKSVQSNNHIVISRLSWHKRKPFADFHQNLTMTDLLNKSGKFGSHQNAVVINTDELFNNDIFVHWK